VFKTVEYYTEMKTSRKRVRKPSDKPKKVTVKFFINKVVQAVIEGKEKRYPLYMLITYNRKNTMLRSLYGHYYKDLKEIDKKHYPGLLSFEERTIKRTIAYELSQQKENFDLKGINKKYEYYGLGIHVILSQHLKSQLWNVLMRLEPYAYAKALNFNDPDVEFETLFVIAKRVYKNLDELLPKDFEQLLEIFQTYAKLYRGSFFQYTFPTVIEWIDQSMLNDYRQKLEAIYKGDKSMINRSINQIDKVIQHNLFTVG